MKKLLVLFVFCAYVFSGYAQSRLSGIEKPQAGSLISFNYQATGGPLENMIRCLVLFIFMKIIYGEWTM